MPLDTTRARRVLPGLLLWLALAVAGLALAQGLTGNFIFDDSWNLRGLASIAADPGLTSAFQYAINGISSSLGRPLTLATFTLQYASWPDHPEDFIAFNIGLHLLNGCLLAALLLRLLRLAPHPPAAPEIVAVGAAALWVLAPLNASAVLYIVQRMASFSATFVFLGALLYFAGRARSLAGAARSGYLLMIGGVGVGTVLGVLAKENAALFPLLILATEYTLGHAWPRDRAWRWFSAVCLVLPAAALIAYLAWHLPEYQAEEARRGYGVGERLMTEARVLFLYLQKLLIPSLYSIRLLYDDLAVSRTLWTPWTTLPSIVAWLALVAAAVRWRTRAPVFAFGVLWFLASHLLESSVVPLELAFEHRNYVGAIGPLVALVWYGLVLWHRADLARVRPALGIAAGAYALFQAAALWQSSALWGRPLDLALYWASTQPDSKRAHYQQADMLLAFGFPGDSARAYEHAMARWPGDPALAIAMLEISCYYPDSPKPSLDRFADAFARFDGQVHAALNSADRLLSAIENGRCGDPAPLPLEQLAGWLATTPAFEPQRQNVLLVQSRVAEIRGDHATAMQRLDEAIRLQPKIPLLVQGIVWAVEAGQFARADEYYALARAGTPLRGVERWVYRDTLQQLRQYIDAHAPGPTG